MGNPAILTHSTARLVEQARRELLTALADPRQEVAHRVAAYTEAVRRHRESIFADVLRDRRLFSKLN